MNWLCRLIGHKWMVKLRHRVDKSLRTEEVVFFACCVRCGEPTPPAIVQGMAGLAQEKGQDHGH